MNSTSGTVADTIPPGKVQGLTAVSSEDDIGIKLSWDKNQETDVATYRIYRSTNEFSNIKGMLVLSETDSQSYADSSLNEGTTYYYAVTALDEEGNEEAQVIPVSATSNDITPPEIFLQSIGSKNTGTIRIIAFVQDKGSGLGFSCEVCISNDGVCDTEFTKEKVVHNVKNNSNNGTCEYIW